MGCVSTVGQCADGLGWVRSVGDDGVAWRVEGGGRGRGLEKKHNSLLALHEQRRIRRARQRAPRELVRRERPHLRHERRGEGGERE